MEFLWAASLFLLRSTLIAGAWIIWWRYSSRIQARWRARHPLSEHPNRLQSLLRRVATLGDLLQALIKKVASSFRLIMAVYLTSLLLGATTFAFFERASFGDGLWWADVTALTIGYGDLSPNTVGGRISAVIFQHFWIFGIAPLVIAYIINLVLPDPHEFTDGEQRGLFWVLWQVRRNQIRSLRLSDLDHQSPGGAGGRERHRPYSASPHG